jgi:hypothetical protein
VKSSNILQTSVMMLGILSQSIARHQAESKFRMLLKIVLLSLAVIFQVIGQTEETFSNGQPFSNKSLSGNFWDFVVECA